MYPEEVKVYIDGKDITQLAFGSPTLTLSDLNRTWRNIDITQFCTVPGVHTVTVTCTGGVGRVEAKVKIS